MEEKDKKIGELRNLLSLAKNKIEELKNTLVLRDKEIAELKTTYEKSCPFITQKLPISKPSHRRS